MSNNNFSAKDFTKITDDFEKKLSAATSNQEYSPAEKEAIIAELKSTMQNIDFVIQFLKSEKIK